MNNVMIIGHLGGDPEVKYFESGACTSRMLVYLNERYMKNGERQESTHRIPVEVWGKSAEYVANYLRQGSHVAVMGSLTEARWTDQATGENRSRLMVKALRVDNLTPKAGDQANDDNDGYEDEEF
ncbi:single-stranded DNA-binding protein [Halomicronema sp. CCY15110]|uniref:single-stranded DNA-binding protein n=1 Tax=Halomicronema sp. CCY15110 TaxID=2767773 RepID=UPI00194F67E2|nr:single-stranded DNA-binding protein [Halomicronema sp. CCY15110]